MVEVTGYDEKAIGVICLLFADGAVQCTKRILTASITMAVNSHPSISARKQINNYSEYINSEHFFFLQNNYINWGYFYMEKCTIIIIFFFTFLSRFPSHLCINFAVH